MKFCQWIASALLLFPLAWPTSQAVASGAQEQVVYLGAGPSRTDDLIDGIRTPFSVGFLRFSRSSEAVYGLDIAGEGTRLDSTWGQSRAINQSTSINLILGRNLNLTASSRFDAALLIGARQKTADCPPSYLGYQCYADREADMTYTFNYGVLLAWTQQRLMLGIRATGVSVQGLIGLSF